MLSLGSWAEILIIVVAALILVGPKDLPMVMKTCGRFIFKLRQFTYQIRHGFTDLINEGQLDEYQHSARNKVMEDDNKIKNPTPSNLATASTTTISGHDYDEPE